MRFARVVLATSLAIACLSCLRARSSRRRHQRRRGPRASSSITPGTTRKRSSASIEVLARHGRDLEILIKRGACYLVLDQPEKAIADFDRVNRHGIVGITRLRPERDLSTPTRRGFRSPLPDIPTSPRAGATAASRC